MKGLTHFAIGTAIASCVPAAVRAGADGHPLYFILGGVFGLLPDTLDFKFYRFFYRRHMEVIPDPNRPDPGMIAGALAYAVERTFKTRRPTRIKLNTIRLGADLWQSYSVTFDGPERQVTVAYGPPVRTSRAPAADPPSESPASASAALACPVSVEYQATTPVDAFDGPMFRMVADAEGGVAVEFVPWHREWTHSFITGALAGVAAGAVWGPLAGAIAWGAWAAHIAVDQVGFMGSNLFFPLTRKRVPGWQRFRSFESLPNFLLTWCSLVVIFGNLYRAAFVPHPLNLVQLAAVAVVIPFGLMWGLRRLLRRPA